MKDQSKYQSQIDNGSWVLDYHKLAASGYGFILLITERGAKGKTFNSKEYMRDKYLEDGTKSIWLMNTQVQIDKDKSKFLHNNRQINPEKWEGCTVKGNGVVDNETGEMFIQFVALRGAEKLKGSRDSSFKIVVYDEFNVGLDSFRGQQTTLFSSLLNTLTDIQDVKSGNKLQVFIHGNNKTLTTPLLVDMKIFEIKGEETYFEKDGVKTVFIYTPKIDKSVVKEHNKNNWVFMLDEMTGMDEHNYFNENLYDNMLSIAPNYDYHRMRLIANYKMDGNFFRMYANPEATFFYFRKAEKGEIDDKKDEIVVGKKDQMEATYRVSPRLRGAVLNLLMKDQILFDSMYSKSVVLDLVK